MKSIFIHYFLKNNFMPYQIIMSLSFTTISLTNYVLLSFLPSLIHKHYSFIIVGRSLWFSFLLLLFQSTWSRPPSNTFPSLAFSESAHFFLPPRAPGSNNAPSTSTTSPANPAPSIDQASPANIDRDSLLTREEGGHSVLTRLLGEDELHTPMSPRGGGYKDNP